MNMILSALFSWWYTVGWADLAKRAGARVDRVLGFFSVGLLARTLFSPFRQISAGRVRGSLDVQVRAFADRLFSRIFGAFIRSVFIVVGFVLAVFAGLLGVIQLIVWPLVPVLPLAGLVLALWGWTL